MNTSNVIGTIYSSRAFTYRREQKQFVAEISEVREVLRQLWNDSMDLGFGIRSERTGKVVFFTLDRQQRDGDDVLFWDFQVYNPYQKPELEGLTVRIFND